MDIRVFLMVAVIIDRTDAQTKIFRNFCVGTALCAVALNQLNILTVQLALSSGATAVLRLKLSLELGDVIFFCLELILQQPNLFIWVHENDSFQKLIYEYIITDIS